MEDRIVFDPHGKDKCVRCLYSELRESFDPKILGGARRVLYCLIHHVDVNSANVCGRYSPLFDKKYRERGKRSYVKP